MNSKKLKLRKEQFFNIFIYSRRLYCYFFITTSQFHCFVVIVVVVVVIGSSIIYIPSFFVYFINEFFLHIYVQLWLLNESKCMFSLDSCCFYFIFILVCYFLFRTQHHAKTIFLRTFLLCSKSFSINITITKY